MRTIIRGIGNALSTIANSGLFCLVVMSLGTIGFTHLLCSYFHIPKYCSKFYAIMIGSAALAIIFYYLLGLLFIGISTWIERHI